MAKKLIILLAAILIMQNMTYAYELNYIEENDNVEEAAERLLNGEFVPITDLFKYPKEGYSSANISVTRSVSKKMYDQLDDVEKDIYDGIINNIDVTKDGASEFTFGTTVIISTGYNYKTTDGKASILADLKNYVINTMGAEITRGAYALIAYDHPEYFWLDPSRLSLGISFKSYSVYNSTTGEMPITCTLKPIEGNDSYYTLCYSSLEQVENDINKCTEIIDSIISTFPENATDYYKVHIINEWLLANNSYNYSSSKSDYAYIAPGALVYGKDEDSSKHAVCEAYAEAFKMICDKAGITCLNGEAFQTKIVTNENGEEEEVKEGHKWNLLLLDGRWYYYDGTWNDTGNSSEIYYKTKYLAIGTDTMSKRDTTVYHDTDKAQLGFTILAMPQGTDYLETKGLENNILTYDMNGDNYITKADCAAGLRAILNNEFSKDINSDSQYDLTDIVSYMRLLYN